MIDAFIEAVTFTIFMFVVFGLAPYIILKVQDKIQSKKEATKQLKKENQELKEELQRIKFLQEIKKG